MIHLSNLGVKTCHLFQCYVQILKDKAVCIGTAMSIGSLSRKFLVDIRGRPLYLMSKEKLFHLTLNFGLSKSFPALLGKQQ